MLKDSLKTNKVVAANGDSGSSEDSTYKYKNPTPGEIPIIGYLVSHSNRFELKNVNPQDIKIEENFTPYVPDEPGNPTELDDRQNVLNISAAGCNLALNVVVTDKGTNYRELQKYAYNKLGLIVSNRGKLCAEPVVNNNTEEDSVKDPFESFINAFKADSNIEDDKYKKVAAFLLYDEPSLELLEGSDYINSNTLSFYYKRLVEKCTPESLDALVFVNLVAIHGKNRTATEYQRYLDAYEENFNPMFYSVDVYPILQWNPLVITENSLSGMSSSLRAGEIVQVHERFYRTLEMVSAQARKKNKPFWYYPLVGEHFNHKSFYYPAQKEEYMRYSIFTALAYGAKGVVLWRMLENIDDRENLFRVHADSKYNPESYMRHPINADRTRSPFWYYVRRIIREIKYYESIFLNSKVVDTFHTGLDKMALYALSIYDPSTPGVLPYVKHGWAPGVENPTPPETRTAEVWGLRPLNSDSGTIFKSIESLEGGLGVLVSHLEDDNNGEVQQEQEKNAQSPVKINYYMVVNHDAANAQKIRLNFLSGYKIKELTPRSLNNIIINNEINTTKTSSLERLLAPGGYIIFQQIID